MSFKLPDHLKLKLEYDFDDDGLRDRLYKVHQEVEKKKRFKRRLRNAKKIGLFVIIGVSLILLCWYFFF